MTHYATREDVPSKLKTRKEWGESGKVVIGNPVATVTGRKEKLYTYETVLDKEITKSALKERGWNDALIHALLGEPDRYVKNHHHRSGPMINLFSSKRVIRAERLKKFQQHLQKKLLRKESADKSRSIQDEKRREMYPSADSLLSDACESLFHLNRYAKHDRCSKEHRGIIYELKSSFLKQLCLNGKISKVLRHIQRIPAKCCFNCKGTGIHYNSNEDCERCNGTGEYCPEQEQEFYVFEILAKDVRYSWHSPETTVDWEIPEETVIEDSDWKPGEVKEVKLSHSKFAEAKRLIKLYVELSMNEK